MSKGLSKLSNRLINLNLTVGNSEGRIRNAYSTFMGIAKLEHNFRNDVRAYLDAFAIALVVICKELNINHRQVLEIVERVVIDGEEANVPSIKAFKAYIRGELSESFKQVRAS